MKIYFSPLACSLAARIAVYEAGANAEFIHVDGNTKTTNDGRDFRLVHPLGLVPAIVLEDGNVVTENAAVLQYIAARFADAKLAPIDTLGRARLQQWLCFIGTELHKALFVPLLDKGAPEAVKAYALAKADSRLSWVASHLDGRETILDRFSVVDGYLLAVLNWTAVLPEIDLARWKPIAGFMQRMRERPHVERAFTEELELYLREVAPPPEAARVPHI